MTQEQLTAFIANAKGNTSLQEQLKAAADINAVAVIAKDAGFSISADDLTKAQSEISEEELEGAAGGTRGLPQHNAFAAAGGTRGLTPTQNLRWTPLAGKLCFL